ncbi:hypothetical protein INT44_002585 [Umbelopsis vinacea]|uniref:RRN7-type domain-containing protein n=1 Tax=Umbelopsis vinacea TaxID=44442 RepID=A0A8H7PF75_9FUNG|nr:hypothetical protein INT44_002585 [Umbelopsis vinacea]
MKKSLKLPPCPICKTRKYRKNAQGHYVCKYGHQLANYQEEEGEEGTHTGIVRTISGAKRNTTVKESKRLSGPRALFIYHQMFQQCLRQLVRVMITKYGAPADLETIVRELWLLYVSHSEVHFQYRKQTAPVATKSTVPDDEIEALEEENNNNDSAEEDIVDEADMKEMPGIDTSEGDLLFGNEKMMRNPNFLIWPNLSYTQLLIFCYLGCVWLRWPVMLADLQRWAIVGKLPYISLTKNLPSEILDTIALRKLTALKIIPNMPILYQQTRQWIGCFWKICKLEFPDSNSVPLLQRGLREIMLPVESYILAQFIFDKLKLSRQVVIARSDPNQPRNSMTVTTAPMDVKIMAVNLFIAKLYYRLDDSDRHELQDVGIYVPPKDVWLKALRANVYRWQSNMLNGGRRIPGEDESDVHNLRDVADMYKHTVHSGLSNRSHKDRILVKLLRKYTKDLQRREAEENAHLPGPFKKTKSNSYWQEGTTLSFIRDPYVRAATSDMQPLYSPISEPSTTPDAHNDRKRTHDQLEEDVTNELAESQEGDVSWRENSNGDTSFNGIDEPTEEEDQNYLSVSHLVKNYQYQDRYMDYNYDEYEFVADFAAKLVGLDKLEMMRIAISLEHSICRRTRSIERYEPWVK